MRSMPRLLPLIMIVVVVAGVYFVGLMNAPRMARNFAVVTCLVGMILAFFPNKFSISALVILLPSLGMIQALWLSFKGAPNSLLPDCSLDLVMGFVSGSFLQIFRRDLNATDKSPCEDHAIHRFQFLTCAIAVILLAAMSTAIVRNIWQNAAFTSIRGFVFNLQHLRTSSFFDDYFPMRESYFNLVAILFMGTIALGSHRQVLSFRVLNLLMMLTALVGLTDVYQNPGFLNIFLNNDWAGAKSLFPDIHSYAAISLVCLCVGIGMSVCKGFDGGKIPWTSLILTFVSLANIWLSQSRTTFYLGILVIVSCVVWFAIRKIQTPLKRTSFFLVALGVTGCFLFFPVRQRTIGGLMADLLTNEAGFKKMSVLLSYRPELWMEAIHFLKDFPLTGIGTGNFFRAASIHSYVQSEFLHTLNGENAHNFFLQLIVEHGLLMTAAFIFVFWRTLRWAPEKQNWLSFAIIGIVLGNIYQHALLVKDLWLWSALFVGLGVNFKSNSDFGKSISFFSTKRLGIVGVLLILGFIWELINSFHRPPFAYGTRCWTKSNILQDSWVLGEGELGIQHRLMAPSPVFELSIQRNEPQIEKYPVQVELTLIEEESRYQKSIVINSRDLQVFRWELPYPVSPSVLQTRVSRCFVPKDLGINGDARTLGLLVNEVIGI